MNNGFVHYLGMMPCLVASSLAFHPEQPDRVAVRALEMGFAGVELLCEPPWHPAAWSAGLVRRVRATGADLSVHVPVADVNLMSPHPGVRAFVEGEIRASLHLAAELRAGTVTFHLGYRPLAGVPHAPPWEAALDAAKRLKRAAEERGVALCLENDPRLPGAYLWDLVRFREILVEVGLAGTLDLGHAWISHRERGFAHLPALLPRLQVVHLHDNAGSGDDHLALGEGDIDMVRAWSLLREVPLAVIEVKDPDALVRSWDWILGREAANGSRSSGTEEGL